MPNSVRKVILEMTNLDERRVLGEKWEEVDKIHLDAYLGLLILAGVYKSKDESTASLWNAETGRVYISCHSVSGDFLYFRQSNPI